MNLPVQPKVLVSILNWNGAQQTSNCLRALQEAIACDSHFYQARVVLIDNHSEDQSVMTLRTQWPFIEIIEASENLGYAAGHALSLPLAQSWHADAICLLNNDAVIDITAIRELVLAWQKQGDSIYAGLEYSLDAQDQHLFHFPARFLSPPFPIHSTFATRQFWPNPPTASDQAQLVGAVIGGLMLLPMAVINQTGWLKAKWFMYGEEIDYCFMHRALGGTCLLVPRARVFHAGAGSSAHDPHLTNLMHYYRTRNEIVLGFDHSNGFLPRMVLMKKVLRMIINIPLNPKRAWWMFLGVVDAMNSRMGKTHDPVNRITRQ